MDTHETQLKRIADALEAIADELHIMNVEGLPIITVPTIDEN